MDDIQTAYYLRVCAVDQSGVHDVDIILLTQRVREGDMNIAIEKSEALDVTCSPVIRIRLETLK